MTPAIGIALEVNTFSFSVMDHTGKVAGVAQGVQMRLPEFYLITQQKGGTLGKIGRFFWRKALK
jgi:hypothetical protein